MKVIVNPEIFMDKSEFSESPLSAEALRQVLRLDGPKVKDKLLIPRVDDE